MKAAGPTGRPRSLADIRAWLAAQIAGQIGIPSADVDVRKPFAAFGLSSRDAVAISGDLEAFVGARLSPTLLWEYPNIEALARHLAGEGVPQGLEVEGEVRLRYPPIAVVGLSCRFPGAPDIESFWRLLRDGLDAIGEVPPDRWDAAAFYDPDPAAPGKMTTRHGGFIEGVDRFDTGFFGLSPREAARMDPQQRILLEVAWEAIENAGHDPGSLRGSSTGVFIGISSSDYALLQMGDTALVDAYTGTGNAHCIAANRLSYLLDLHGPSLAVDTACSSSLVAIHQACQSLRARECDLALAGGVNLILAPQLAIAFSKAGMMAPDGRCKTFDEAADGYVRGEGCGLVLLRRLSEALADGDDVWAVIRGTAVNQDGLSNGLTAPNGLAQQAVIRQALRNAGVAAADIGCIEAHGTGTPLGDPIEIEALKAVLLPGRPADQPCAIGSVKTNIGHLEAAAGVAGLIKLVLALRHGEIPPHLHLKRLNSRIALEGTPLCIPVERRPWKPGPPPRRGGVSSFGFGGTNAHVVLEEALPRHRTPAARRETQLLVLSARSPEALRVLARRFADRVASLSGPSLDDACAVSRRDRSAFRHRLTATGDHATWLVRRLEAFLNGELPAGVAVGEAGRDPARVAFLFSGQGSQYAGMGRQLYEGEPVFRQVFDRCAALFEGRLPVPLLDLLRPSPEAAPLLDRTDCGQAALFSLQVALAAQFRSWGIAADAVAGHSVGAYAAACAAGVLDLADAARLIAERARLMQALPRGGEMAAILASEAQVAEVVAQGPGQVSIAAVNGPAETVVSGDSDAVAAVVRQLRRAGARSRRLAVSHAFHSPLMDPILDEFETVAGWARFNPPKIPFVSDLTGEVAAKEMITRPQYWRRHVREPVRFARAVETLRKLGTDVFLEIGPGSTLVGMVERSSAEGSPVCVASLRKGADDLRQVTRAVGALWAAGVAVDWKAFDGNRPLCRTALPTYPFERQRCWFQPGTATRPTPAPEPAGAYAVAWEEQPAARRGGARQGLRLIFADAGGVATALAGRLKARGETCVTVTAGGRFEALGGGSFVLDPSDPAGFDRLWREAVEPVRLPCLGAAHLWALDITVDGDAMAAQRLGPGSALLLAQLLGRHATGPRLHVVTRRAQSVTAGEAPVPARATLWGMGRALALEAPALWGGLIDLDGTVDAEALAGELEEGGGQVAWRDGRRLVARLVPAPLPAGDRWRPRPDGSYLLTGGLGAIGLALASWLVDRGARHLVLTARRGAATPGREEAVAALRSRGASVRIVAADVTDVERLGALLDSWDGPPLRGVFHCAGVTAPRPFGDIDAQALRDVLAPKVAGGGALDRLTCGRELDCFVLFSSISSVLGSARLAHYAAANAFLDALALQRRAAGRPALSVSWGPWTHGMTTEEERHLLARVGMHALPPPRALSLLGQILASDAGHVAVAHVDWDTFLPVYEARACHPFVERLRPAAAPVPPAGARARLRREIDAAPAARRAEILVTWMRAQVARILGLDGPDRVDPRQGFFELGLDSLTAVELKRLLESQLGCRLPRTVAFEHPTPEALSAFLVRECLGDGEAADGAPTDAGATAMLQEELRKLNY